MASAFNCHAFQHPGGGKAPLWRAARPQNLRRKRQPPWISRLLAIGHPLPAAAKPGEAEQPLLVRRDGRQLGLGGLANITCFGMSHHELRGRQARARCLSVTGCLQEDRVMNPIWCISPLIRDVRRLEPAPVELSVKGRRIDQGKQGPPHRWKYRDAGAGRVRRFERPKPLQTKPMTSIYAGVLI